MMIERPRFGTQSTRRGYPRLTWIVSVALTANLAGFLAVSYIPGMIGLGSEAATVPFRALALLIFLTTIYRLLVVGHLRRRLTVTTVIVVSFWIAYLLRFAYDAAIAQVPLGEEPWKMGLYLLGITFPTFVVFYLVGDLRLYTRALPWCVLLLGSCCFVSLMRTASAKDVELTGRFSANDVLNPIGYGHMGVTAIILGTFILLNIGHARHGRLMRLFSAGAVFVGIFTVLAASSRGAFVAALIVVTIILYLGIRRGSRRLTVGIVILGVIVTTTSLGYLSQRGAKTQEALASGWADSVSSQSVFERQGLARDAFREYMEHPLIGSSMVERNSLTYPHNSILEAYMATGTLFGTVFLLMLLIASYRAILITRRNVAMAWLPLCFFQFLIGSMFSGGLYSNPLLFGMMAIMLGVDLPRPLHNPRRVYRRISLHGQSSSGDQSLICLPEGS